MSELSTLLLCLPVQQNAITGTWNPAAINTATVGTTTYTFTPAAGQCATTATMDIVITTSIIPTFTQIGPLCQNSVLLRHCLQVQPIYRQSPVHGIPATISTATVGTTTYTFTPAAGQCATTTTMDIVITTSIIPTFTQIGPLCQNSTAPALPASSTNTPAITGTWNPATISTATVGNSDLYLYSCCRSVCHYHNNGYCGNYFYYPDIYTDRTAMPELNRSGTACKFN